MPLFRGGRGGVASPGSYIYIYVRIYIYTADLKMKMHQVALVNLPKLHKKLLHGFSKSQTLTDSHPSQSTTEPKGAVVCLDHPAQGTVELRQKFHDNGRSGWNVDWIQYDSLTVSHRFLVLLLDFFHFG